MLIRIKRTFASFVSVLVVFWVYRLIAVPLIEPQGDSRRVVPASRDNRDAALRKQRQNRLSSYLRFFPEGAWQRDDPIMLESDGAKLLTKSYENRGDEMVLKPCTVIYLPQGEIDGGAYRRVIILDAPEAVVRFDQPVDLRKGGQWGRIVGGQLIGQVTIHSGPTRPEAGDDFSAVTRDVKMDGDLVSTPHPVDFRFGSSWGHGREMRIVLAPSTEASAKSRGPNVGGVQTIELVREVEMHLVPPASRAAAEPPVEIRCQGPFDFDPVGYEATFHDQVTAIRPNPTGSGPSDQLICELLRVFFEPRQSQAAVNGDRATASEAARAPAAASAPSGTPRLEPRKFEALGNPVIVRAPSRALEAQARSISYRPDSNDRWLGTMESVGPGWLKAASLQDPTRKFELSWQQELKMRPQDENHVVSVVGDARAASSDQGEIRATEIHLWLFETPPKPPLQVANSAGPGGRGNVNRNDISERLWPVKLMAQGDVHFDSSELSGEVNRLESFFKSGVANAVQQGLGLSGNPRSEPGRQSAGANRPLGMAQIRRTPPTHYEIKHGDLLKTTLAYQPRTAIEQATVRVLEAEIRGNVWFVESTGQPGEQPLEIRGDELDLSQADTNAQVKVVGQPTRLATVTARGLTLLGQTVQLDRGANRLWIDGPGRMTRIDDRPAAAKRDPRTTDQSSGLFSGRGDLTIDWQDGMNFDGRTAQFNRDVVAQLRSEQGEQTLRAPRMDATLRQAIDFSAARPQGVERGQSEVEQIVCHGDVRLEGRELRQGQVIAINRLFQISDLAVNNASGLLTAQVPGPQPGRMWSWRLGNSLADGLQPARRGAAAASRSTPADQQIYFFDVQFQQGITGNVSPGKRELRFFDQVHGFYGPVASWDARLDADTVEALRPGMMDITCEELTINESPTVTGARPQAEVKAEKNAKVEGCQTEGDMFTAMASRISYAQTNGMVTLDGGGYADAKLYFQQRPGASRSTASGPKFQYWPATRAVVGSPRIIQSNGFSGSPLPSSRTTPATAQPVMPRPQP